MLRDGLAASIGRLSLPAVKTCEYPEIDGPSNKTHRNNLNIASGLKFIARSGQLKNPHQAQEQARCGLHFDRVFSNPGLEKNRFRWFSDLA